MSASDITLDTLKLPPLTEFLAGNLRSLYLAFTKSPEAIPRSKEELVEALKPHVEDVGLTRLIAQLEGTQTFRHLYIYALAKHPGGRSLTQSIAHLNETAPTRVFEKTDLYYLGDCQNDYPLLRLAHPVTNSYYVPDGIGRMKIETSSFRHAVVIAIKPELGVVEIRFNGYEQTKYTSENNRISYQDVAESCKQFLFAHLNIELRGLPLKQPVEELVENYGDEVSHQKNVSRVGGGRISLDAGDSDDASDLNELLKKAFQLKGTGTSPTLAMNSWTAEHVTLKWSRFNALTRIDYTGETPEVMFSWKSSEHRSLKNQDQIIKTMVAFTDLDRARDKRRFVASLSELTPKDVLTVLDVSQRVGAPGNDVMEFLLEQVSARRMRMLFRVKTDSHLLDLSNNWVPSVAELPRQAQTMDGDVIDLSDPTNIEVGFAMVETRQ